MSPEHDITLRAEVRVFPDGFCAFTRYGIEGLAAGRAPNFTPAGVQET